MAQNWGPHPKAQTKNEKENKRTSERPASGDKMYGKAANIPIAAQNPVSLVGKSVLVVGGTAGLGRAIAEACINAG
jgi:hypothetical protein